MSDNSLFAEDQIALLKKFILLCKSDSQILYRPEIAFFKDWLLSIGARIPMEMPKHHNDMGGQHFAKDMPSAASTKESPIHSEPESDEIESDIELDKSLIVEPDVKDDQKQLMGDDSMVVSEENEDEAENLRAIANKALGDGNFDEALKLYTDAILKNPHSAALYAKRAQILLKRNCPKSAIKDCDKALELNPDSSLGLRIRGKANCMLGNWIQAKIDLAQSLKIDFDPDTNDLLKQVMPNATKIEEHERKKIRKKEEKLDKERQERIRKAREAHEKAKKEEEAKGPQHSDPDFAGPGAGMGDFFKTLMSDPEIMQAFQDPEVAAAFQDISANPANMIKYQSNPKISAIIEKMMGKLGGGMPGGASAGAQFTPPDL